MKGRYTLLHVIQHANHLIRCGDAGVPFSQNDKLLMMQAAKTLSQLKNKAVVRLHQQHCSVAYIAKTLQISRQAVENILHKQLDVVKDFSDCDVSVSESILSIQVQELDLSTRTKNCLLNHEIITIKQLLEHDQVHLLKLPNFGRRSLNEVVDVLDSYQLRLPLKRLT